MDKFIAVFKREYLERVRTRAFIIGTIAVPLFMAAIFLVPVYLASKQSASANAGDIAVIDATGQGLGARVITRLTADSTIRAAAKQPQLRTITPEQLASAESTATKQVMSKQITGFLILTDSTTAGRSARYAGRNASTIGDIEKVQDAVRQGVMNYRLEKEGVQPARVEELSKISVRVTKDRIDDKGKGGQAETAIIVGFGIAILLYMSIILHGQNVMRGVMEEKTSRVAEVVLSSVKPDTLLAGKVLGVGAVGLTQQVLWLLISTYLMSQIGPLIMRPDVRAAASSNAAASQGIASVLSGNVLSLQLFVAVLAFFLVGFVFYATLFAAVGAMVNSDQEAQQAAAPITIMLVGTFVLVQGIIVNPNGALANVLSWLPFSSPIVMPMRMVLAPQPWYLVVGSIAVGMLGCVAAVWVAARIYRVGMLMYGKKPSLPELVKWIKYA